MAANESSLSLMVYDDTCRGRGPLPGMTHSWIAGGLLYRALDRFDAIRGVETWDEALDWLQNVEGSRPIAEIQFWGHGKWGRVLVDGNPLDVSALAADSPYHDSLGRIRERLVGAEALWWFRTCETFGAEAGHEFARKWSDFFDCRVASHTYIIGPYQSGLHVLSPGGRPDWPLDEGLAEGTTSNPERAEWSTPWKPNTIFCLTSELPDGHG